MSDTYVVAVEGLSELRRLDQIPKAIETAAYRAINRTADRTATRSRERIREQVNFPARYLTGVDGSGKQRLGVSEKARSGSLEATITGRFRPTSLARFTRGGSSGKAGVTVEVAPGFARLMKRAFLIRLRAGSADIETKSNQGLAIRLRPGETIKNKTRAITTKGGLTLLMGPSVDQLFRTVRNDVSPEALDFLEREFSRLLEIDI